MKLSEERCQRLMKLLPKWEKGKTWQSMFPDKVLAPLRAREMDRWIDQALLLGLLYNSLPIAPLSWFPLRDYL